MPIGRDVNGNAVQTLRLGKSHDVTDSQSPQMFDNPTVLRIAAITDARILITPHPDAVAADGTFMPAGSVEYFSAMGTDLVKCSGSINVTECS